MSILDEIFLHKRKEVEHARARVSLADLKENAQSCPPAQGFMKALQNSPHPLALIAEVKAASPSEGTIRANFDPESIAKSYANAGADALSVLTDQKYFGGDSQNIRLAKDAAKLPALRKDFIYDEYQIWEAKLWGADAFLLIAAALANDELAHLLEIGQEAGLDALVEVHTKEETERALTAGATLIGVNNRDLSTFETRLETSEELLPLIAPHALAVSESALKTHDDLLRVQQAGARAVLIGTRFCQSDDIESAVHEVMNR